MKSGRSYDKVIILFLTGLIILENLRNFDLIGLNFKWGILVVKWGLSAIVMWFANPPEDGLWAFSSAFFLKKTSKFDSFMLFFFRGILYVFVFNFCLLYFSLPFVLNLFISSTWTLYKTVTLSCLAR